MNSIDFLNLKKGEIGKLSYYKRVKVNVSQEERDKQISSLTGNYLDLLISKKCFGENIDLNHAFEFSRNHAKKDLSNYEYNTVLFTIYYQIKNKDSYNNILDIEQDVHFLYWTDEILIERIKKNHNE